MQLLKAQDPCKDGWKYDGQCCQCVFSLELRLFLLFSFLIASCCLDAESWDPASGGEGGKASRCKIVMGCVQILYS